MLHGMGEISRMNSIGFTGTRNGLKDVQRYALLRIIRDSKFNEIHIGDCIGADDECINLIQLWAPDVVLVGHPPDLPALRAYRRYNIEHAPNPYLDRNRDIVDESELLIACPAGPEELRSGTWSTVRYARKTGKPVIIIYPNGKIVRQENKQPKKGKTHHQ